MQKQHDKEIKQLRQDLQKQYDDSRLTQVEAARKESQAEIERLKAENAVLQSTTKKSAPDENKARVKFYISELQQTFSAIVETVKAVDNAEEKAKYKAALKTVVEQLGGVVNEI